MADLNKDVLKRTDGLLAKIDRVVSEVPLAERVQRTLESAAPAIGSWVWDDAEVWMQTEASESLPDGARPNPCRCHQQGRAQHRECVRAHANTHKETVPFFFNLPPFYAETGVPHSAPYGCGVEGCGCEEVFDQLPPWHPAEKAKRAEVAESMAKKLSNEMADTFDRMFRDALASGPTEEESRPELTTSRLTEMVQEVNAAYHQQRERGQYVEDWARRAMARQRSWQGTRRTLTLFDEVRRWPSGGD